jgi:hypothetical protein
MMYPEDLPCAAKFNHQDAFAFLQEARNEASTAQWVLVRNLIAQVPAWFTEAVGKESSLGMTDREVGAYFQGYLLPLLCLQAARLALDEGKENYLSTAGEWEENPGLIFAMQNLDGLMGRLKQDPSGELLMQEMSATGGQDMPDPYFVRGLRYAEKIYGQYMDFFFNYRDQVDLW